MRIALVSLLLIYTHFVCHAGDPPSTPSTDYKITVGPNEDLSDWYLSRSAALSCVFDTLPRSPKLFKAGTGSVVDSKPHSRILWVEQKDEETIHEAKSPPIPKDATSWVKCAGAFKVVGGPGPGGPTPVPTWKTQLKEKPGHIILVHIYTGPASTANARNAQNNVIRLQGKWYYEFYKEGGARQLVTIGVGGDIPNITGLGAWLATKDLTPNSVATVDDLGHGKPYNYGVNAGETVTDPDTGAVIEDTRTSTMINTNALLSADSGAKIAPTSPDIADQIVVGTLVIDPSVTGVPDNNGNQPITAPQYTAQYSSYLKSDAKVDLLHCFTADPNSKKVTHLIDNTVTTTALPTVAELFKTALGATIQVIGYTGCVYFPGNSVPTGTAVKF